MRNFMSAVIVLVVIAVLVLGCSSGSNNATSPSADGPDISVGSQRQLLGIWRLNPDLENQSTKIEFARDLALHFDITENVAPPAVLNESYDGNTQIYQADLTIDTTGLPSAAYDVRLIVFTDNVGTVLKNPDNWTSLYDMPGGSFINPFKAYAKTEPYRRFLIGASHTETVNIYLPGGILYANIVFAIDASIPSNCEEPYLINNFTQEFLGTSIGGSANITVDVYDWQTDVDSVKLLCSAITGNASDDFSFATGNTWSMNLVNNNGAAAGEYFALISATSVNLGSFASYDVITIGITSYEWAKTWGAGLWDEGHSISVDQSGNAYVTGSFQNTVDFNPDGGGTQTSNGQADAFLSKFDSSGNWQWSITWGGIGVDEARSIAIDQSGNIYISGDFENTVDFNPGGGGTHSSNGNSDVFLSKFDSSGNWLWTKTWGGINDDEAWSVGIDQSDNSFVSGWFQDIVNFNPVGGGTQSSIGSYDAFLSKFDSSGNWQWSKTWGASIGDVASSVSLDQLGNAYVAGSFNFTVDFNPDGGGTQSSNGSWDIFLSKFNSSGNWQWSKTWGGLDFDEGLSVALDQSNNAYVTGYFQETVEFNPDGGGTQSSGGGADAFLSKFNSSGNWQWSRICGGTGHDIGRSVAVDQLNNVYLTGAFQNTVEFNPVGGGSHSAIGGSDVYLSKFYPSGTWQGSKTWGGPSAERGQSIAFVQSGSVYVAGYFQDEVDFNPDGGDPHTSNGSSDVFLWKGHY